MILVFHKDDCVTSIRAKREYQDFEKLGLKGKVLTEALHTLGVKFSDQLIVWCREELEHWLNENAISDLVRNPLNLISFRQNGDAFGYSLDYLEYSTSINVKAGVRYPTWKMSSTVGAAFGGLFKCFPIDRYQLEDADFFFSALARSYQPHGLLCYHEPRLLLEGAPRVVEKIQNDSAAFRFARQIFAMQWSFFLFISMILFEGKWRVISFINSLLYPKINLDPVELNRLRTASESVNLKETDLDILIPTLGREQYVYQLLKNLAAQTLLPKKVIIIEQEREKEAGSQMAF